AVAAEDFRMHADERHARFNEPARDEQTGTAHVASVTIAQRVGFARQIERLARLAGGEHVERALLEMAQAIDRAGTPSRLELSVELVEHRTSPVQTIHGQAR